MCCLQYHFNPLTRHSPPSLPFPGTLYFERSVSSLPFLCLSGRSSPAAGHHAPLPNRWTQQQQLLLTKANPVVTHAEQRAVQTLEQRHERRGAATLSWDHRRSPLSFFSSFTLTILDLMSGCGRALIVPPAPHKHLIILTHSALAGTVSASVSAGG